MHRFSYNLAVSGGVSNDSNLIQQVSPVAALPYDVQRTPPSFDDQSMAGHSPDKPVLGYTNSAKSHNKSSSIGSLTQLSVCFPELAELDLVDEQRPLDWLLPGEELKFKELKVAYHKQDRPERIVFGRIYVTNYRLRFEEWLRTGVQTEERIQVDVTLGSVAKVEKVGYYNALKRVSSGGGPYGIDLHCKDIRSIRFINRRESHGRRALFECLRKYAFPNTNRLPFFATLYREKFVHNGWTLFDVVREFQRQQVQSNAWQLCRMNAHYEFAGTYPSLFFVPAEVFRMESPDDFLFLVSEFRSKRRIPVLSWIDHRSSAALVRSSQPLVGALSRKSASDEDYVQMVINANPNSGCLVILDARPRINARANRANGGGYEDYERCKLQFMDIQNIHAVRDSLKKLKEACFPRIRQKRFQKMLEETKWLAHLQTILEAAALAAREISVHRNSVLVHCSDGWDRTAQITSLAMLQLDPFFRTLEGFAILVEKEWSSFGHKFAHRVGHGQDKPNDPERSPIFVQFVDCVWQLYNQFTSAFQFNVRFLKTLLDELYSCRFGTFLYNTERERTELDVKRQTASLWSYILDNRMLFVNEHYDPSASLDDFVQQKSRIHPLFWTGYYCRYSQLLPQEAEDGMTLVGGGSKPATPSSAFPPVFIGISGGETNRGEQSERQRPSADLELRPHQMYVNFSPLTPDSPVRQRRWISPAEAAGNGGPQ